jgi:hypothetical protein
MNASPSQACSQVYAVVKFPLIDQTLRVGAETALTNLSGAVLRDVVFAQDSQGSPGAVFQVLTALDDEDVVQALHDYRTRYRELNRRLREHRGYGLDGDAEPEVAMAATEVLPWLQQHRPAVLDELLVEHFSPDITLSRQSRRWTWSTRSEPVFLPKALGSRQAACSHATKRQAMADVVQVLDLRALFALELQAAA